MTDRPDTHHARAAAEALRALSQELESQGAVSLSDLLAWRDEGRAGRALHRAAAAVGVKLMGDGDRPPIT